MPGLKEMLDGLHEQEILVGVISAAGSEVVEADVARLDLEGRFAFVRCSASPKREALGQLAGQSGGRVAYLGDTEHDITEALAAGAYPIGFAGGYRPGDALEAAGAGHVVGDLSRVPELLVDDLKTSPTHR